MSYSTGYSNIDHTRYFVNPWLDRLASPQSSDVAATTTTTVTASTAKSLHRVEQLIQKCHTVYASEPPSSLGTLYCGGLGPVVFLTWRWAMFLAHHTITKAGDAPKDSDGSDKTSRNSKSQMLLEQALTLAQNAAHYHASRDNLGLRRRHIRVTLLESPYVGAKAMESVLCHALGQEAAARNSAQDLISWLDTNNSVLGPDECEVLYGRSGAIHAILFLRQQLQDPQLGSPLVLKLAEEIVLRGKKNSRRNFTLLWNWHDSLYLGAAHGVVGILHTLLSLNDQEIQVMDQRHSMLSLIHQTLNQMNQNHCFPSGNLDSSIKEPTATAASAPRKDRLVQWCHGAVGHVLLLLRAAQVFPESAAVYQKLACDIANHVLWPRGLLQKGVGLCHGISGNAYPLLSLSALDASFLDMANHFADFALEHLDDLEDVPDRPYSLYEGLGGLCLLILDLIEQQRTPHAKAVNFPLYTFD